MRLAALLQAALDDTLKEIAEEYCDDLSQHLRQTHRVTGLLAESIGYEVTGPGEVIAGSSVPYAGYFEARTGAVEAFTDDWQREGGTVAVRAGQKAAARRLPDSGT